MTRKLTPNEKHDLKLCIINHPFHSNIQIAEIYGCDPRSVAFCKRELNIPDTNMRNASVMHKRKYKFKKVLDDLRDVRLA